MTDPKMPEPVFTQAMIDAIYAAWHGAGVDIAGGNWPRFVGMLPNANSHVKKPTADAQGDPKMPEPVAYVDDLSRPQPHCVTSLKYCSVLQHQRGDHLRYTPVVTRESAQAYAEALAAQRVAQERERTYTRAQLLSAIKAERHACSIAVWMTLQDALEHGADDGMPKVRMQDDLPVL